MWNLEFLQATCNVVCFVCQIKHFSVKLTYSKYDTFICFAIQTVQHNAYDQDPYAKEFGIKISENLASVEARVLPAPWVEFS